MQRQLKRLQHAIAVRVGGNIAVTALRGELQRTAQVASGGGGRLSPAA